MTTLNVKFGVHPNKILKALKMGAFCSTPFKYRNDIDIDRLINLFGISEEDIDDIDDIMLSNNIVPFHLLMQNSGIYDIVTEADILSLFSKKNFTQLLLYTKDLLEIADGRVKILDIINTAEVKSIKELKEMLDLSFYYTLGYTYDDRFNREVVYDDEISYKINRNNAFPVTTAQYMLCNIMRWDRFYKLANKIDKKNGKKILFTHLVSKLNSVILNLSGLNHQMITNDTISNTVFNNHIRSIDYTTDRNSFEWLIDNGLNMAKIHNTPHELVFEFPHVFDSVFSIKKYSKAKFFNNLDPELFTILVKSAGKVQYIRELFLSMIAGVGNIIDTPYGMIVQYSYKNISKTRKISQLVFDIYSIVVYPDTTMLTPNIDMGNEPLLKN